MAALSVGESKNMFVDINEEVHCTSTIVPPRSIANNAVGGCFIDKTFNRDQIEKNNHAWHGGDQSGRINVRAPSLSHLMKDNQERDQMMATMATNIALLTKKLIESEIKKVHDIDETINGVRYSHGYPPHL
ncbi:hypothetical protein HAX54_037475 [Datura stramonium]|uniref:Uncharacterized protein n=1 Tax=Datura stramonium TaxID=4076 RepID=A0ABS8VID1_DATST|nr:hypothetical protein [Datura stramonium]